MDDEKRYDVDDILSEIGVGNAPETPAEQLKDEVVDDIVDEVTDDGDVVDTIIDDLPAEGEPSADDASAVAAKKPFVLNLDLDSEYGEAVEVAPIVREEVVHTLTPPEEPSRPEKQPTPKKPRKKYSLRWLVAIVYTVFVIGTSVLLASTIWAAIRDFTGLAKNDPPVEIQIRKGATVDEVVAQLEEKGLIEEPWLFRLYLKIAKAENTWKPGVYTMEAGGGYQGIKYQFQFGGEREVVKVTFPEGFTVLQMAERLESNGICSKSEFLRAVNQVDYSKEYDFIAAFAKVDEDRRSHRRYKLEGYLFPDTYNFYKNCSGELVVRKMLDNFNQRVNTTMRTAAANSGYSVDELVTMASIVQGEAANKTDMIRVAQVILNRMEDPVTYPKLQCDSTADYIKKILSKDATDPAYDTYQCDGLPAGAINCPGLDAFDAMVDPDEDMIGYYYFATDYSTGITYYSKTLQEHEATCKKYGIGMYAK